MSSLKFFNYFLSVRIYQTFSIHASGCTFVAIKVSLAPAKVVCSVYNLDALLIFPREGSD